MPENPPANVVASANFLETTSGYVYAIEATPITQSIDNISSVDDDPLEEAKRIDEQIEQLQIARVQAVLRSGKTFDSQEEKEKKVRFPSHPVVNNAPKPIPPRPQTPAPP